MKIQEIHERITKNMKVSEDQANPENYENLRSPYENHKNH